MPQPRCNRHGVDALLIRDPPVQRRCGLDARVKAAVPPCRWFMLGGAPTCPPSGHALTAHRDAASRRRRGRSAADRAGPERSDRETSCAEALPSGIHGGWRRRPGPDHHPPGGTRRPGRPRSPTRPASSPTRSGARRSTTPATRSRCPRPTWPTSTGSPPSSSATAAGQRLRLPPQRRHRRRRLALQRRRAGRLLAFGRAHRRRRHRHRLRRAAATPADPTAGGYQAISPNGGDQWFVQETNPGDRPHAALGRRGLADRRQPTPAATASRRDRSGRTPTRSAPATARCWAASRGSGRLGLLDGGGGRPLRGRQQRDHQRRRLQRRCRLRRRPTPTAATSASSRARATPAPGTRPAASSASTTRTRTSTARRRRSGQFLAGGAVGIAIGDGSYYSGASDSDKVFALNTSCGLAWSDSPQRRHRRLARPGRRAGQRPARRRRRHRRPGTIYVLNGTNGGVIWSADDRGPGHRLAGDGRPHRRRLPGRHRPDHQRHRHLRRPLGRRRWRRSAPTTAFQSSPLVTDDPDGHIGITGAGYDDIGGDLVGVIAHWEIDDTSGSGASVYETGRLAAVPPRPPADRRRRHAGAAPSRCRATRRPADPTATSSPPPTAACSTTATSRSAGRPGSIHLNKPVVASALTHDGGGYWEVASDGGIFAFGDAGFYGSMGGKPLNAADRRHGGDARTAAGTGWWPPTAASSASATPASTAAPAASTSTSPIVGMAATPDGKGYWLVASDGGIFSYGDAKFSGSMGGQPLNHPIVGHGRRRPDRRVLGGGGRRRHLLLRRPVLRLDRQHAPQRAHRRHGGQPRTARATASWRPTAGSSATTRRSSGRWAASRSTNPSWPWRGPDGPSR